jgi:hypothetical protein
VSRLLGALLAALTLAACGGGSSDDDYRDQFPSIDRQLAALGRDVTATLRVAGEMDDAALAGAFAAYARRLERLREQLDELEPPAALEQGDDELVGEMKSTGAALSAVAAAVRAGDAAAAGEAATTLVRSGARLDEARRDQAQALAR